MKTTKKVIGIFIVLWTLPIAVKILVYLSEPNANSLGMQYMIYIGLTLIISGNIFLLGVYFLIKLFRYLTKRSEKQKSTVGVCE